MRDVITWLNGWNAGGKISIIWFLILAGFLVFFALKIVKQAEVLTAKTKFGGGLIGGVLIAIITSFPEFITSIEQSIIGDPGAGSADNIGANAISGFLIGLAALLFIRETFLNRLKKWTIITLWISFTISLFITLMMFFKTDIIIGSEGHYAIGLVPLILLILYFILLLLQYKFGNDEEHVLLDEYVKATSVKQASWRFLIWGVLLMIGSIGINISVASMEDGYSISQESAGGILLSVAMAIPEGVAFFAMMKDKQYSSAVAILVGHGFALFVSEWLGDMSYIDAPTYTTEAVHKVWPISVITTTCFSLLATAPLLGKKFKIFRENKIVYSIIPIWIILIYIVGWLLILTLYY